MDTDTHDFSSLFKAFADSLKEANERLQLVLLCKMRRFYLIRDADATGVSGTGIVAEGVVFEDGTAALRWKTQRTSTAVYASVDDIVAIHGHNGKTKVVFLDGVEPGLQ